MTLFNRDHLIDRVRRDHWSPFSKGLALAIVAGTVLGVLVGVSDRAARALQPLFEFMRAIPPPVTVPVASLLIGYSETMKLTVDRAVGALADPVEYDVGGASDRSAAARCRALVPAEPRCSASAGSFFRPSCRRCCSASAIAIPLAIVVTLLVEMLTSLPGIGALMIRSQRNFQSSEVYALLVLVGLFGFVVNDLFAIDRRRHHAALAAAILTFNSDERAIKMQVGFFFWPYNARSVRKARRARGPLRLRDDRHRRHARQRHGPVGIVRAWWPAPRSARGSRSASPICSPDIRRSAPRRSPRSITSPTAAPCSASAPVTAAPGMSDCRSRRAKELAEGVTFIKTLLQGKPATLGAATAHLPWIKRAPPVFLAASHPGR